MENFTVKDLLSSTYGTRSPKLRSLIEMCKYVFGDSYTSSEESIYVKNLYNFTYRKCEIKDVEIYTVYDNKFYVISYIENENSIGQNYLKSYNLKDIELVELKEHKAYGEIILDLNIKFKSNVSYTLNNSIDTYEEVKSEEYREIIIDIFNKLK